MHTHARTHTVLSVCCDTDECKKCIFPDGLTFSQCERIELPSGCPEKNRTHLIPRLQATQSKGKYHATALITYMQAHAGI